MPRQGVPVWVLATGRGCTNDDRPWDAPWDGTGTLPAGDEEDGMSWRRAWPAVLAAVVTAGCSSGNSMSDEAVYVFEQHPDEIERTCGGFGDQADSVEDLVGQLEGMDADERADVMDGFDSNAGEELPDDAGEWSWAQVLDFHRAVWAECERLDEL